MSLYQHSTIHAALEIGSSKTCIMIAKSKPEENNSLEILGIGETTTTGMLRGNIQNADHVKACIREARFLAETSCKTKFNSCLLSITGSHIKGRTIVQKLTFTPPTTDVSYGDIKKLDELVHNIDCYEGEELIKTHSPRYLLNEKYIDKLPLGLQADSIGCELHAILGKQTEVNNLIRLVNSCQIDIPQGGMVFAPIASAMWALDGENPNEQTFKEGSLLIDMGGGTSDYALYLNNHLIASGCLPVGGDHITNDIHMITGIPFKEAEEIKIKYGNCEQNHPSVPIELYDKLGYKTQTLDSETINKIIKERVSDIFSHIMKELDPRLLERLTDGVFLTGGSSLLPGLAHIAHNIFSKNVFIQKTFSQFKKPKYHTLLGLLRYSQLLQQEKNALKQEKNKRLFQRLWPF